jgi:hypothetical protein
MTFRACTRPSSFGIPYGLSAAIGVQFGSEYLQTPYRSELVHKGSKQSFKASDRSSMEVCTSR